MITWRISIFHIISLFFCHGQSGTDLTFRFLLAENWSFPIWICYTYIHTNTYSCVYTCIHVYNETQGRVQSTKSRRKQFHWIWEKNLKMLPTQGARNGYWQPAYRARKANTLRANYYNNQEMDFCLLLALVRFLCRESDKCACNCKQLDEWNGFFQTAPPPEIPYHVYGIHEYTMLCMFIWPLFLLFHLQLIIVHACESYLPAVFFKDYFFNFFEIIIWFYHSPFHFLPSSPSIYLSLFSFRFIAS